jgi:hypothetical protein
MIQPLSIDIIQKNYQADLNWRMRRRSQVTTIWVEQGINAWMIAAGIEDGRLLRSVSKSGKVSRDTLSDLVGS